MIPELLNNRYRIIRALGTGGFGETFLAEDTHMPSGRLCVIKQLKPVTNSPEVYQLVQQRFGREAAILEQLGEGSEQIPRLYAYFAEQGRFYLVQEWIEGVTLNQKVQQQGLVGESWVKQMLVSILPVLEYIHTRRIIHRDIKPSNIILRQQDGKPILIDFGIAKEIMATTVDDGGEVTSTISVGTPGYMPPEQAAGKPVFASDLYSLGLTAIYLLTGKRPQDLETNPQTGETIWRSHADSSPQFAAVLDKAIRPNADDRYPSARQMLFALQSDTQEWRHHQETIPLNPIPPSPAETTKPPEPEIQPPPASSKEISQTRTDYTPQSYRDRQILLNKVKNYWVKGVLETSLHGKALMALALEKRLDAVDRPWGMLWETPDQPRLTLPQNTRVIDLFYQMGAGRTLLILGAPGAGKTTTLLELARDLITSAEQDINQPMPVVFNLSAWTNEKQKLNDWLVRELNTKYQVSKEIGKSWIKNQQLLLLLDGLDEVSALRRELCVEAINKFSLEYGQTEIVVACRIKDYEVLTNRLRFQGAVFIQPLTREQIHRYFASAGPELAAINTALQADTVLQELASSPLMLSIMTFAYQGMSVTDLPGMNLEQRRQHLFDKYIQRMFDRRCANRQYSQEQAMRWLTWLAQRLSQQSQTVFLIERMQPECLVTKLQKRLYVICTLLIFMLFTWLIVKHFFPIIKTIYSLLIAGLIGWLIIRLDRIKPVETLKFSWKKTRNNLIFGLIVGPVIGLTIRLIYTVFLHPLHWKILDYSMIQSQTYVISRGLVFGLSLGLVFGLIRGLSGPGIETITVPNQGIWQSAKNAIIFGSIGYMVLSLAAHLMNWSISYWGIFGLYFGLAVGGGEACLKHFILRVVLYYSGYIPWNYARFLDYAGERIFLQKVGGGYIFVHRLLLEHFAQMQPE